MKSKISIFDIFTNVWNNQRFKISCIATVVMCFAAHAYSYFNATFLHDRTRYFMTPVFNGALRGKWLANYIDVLTNFAYLPWLCGMLSMIFLAVSVYLIVKILDVKKGLSIFLIAVLCVTDNAVLGAHFYWPQEILAALLMACLSAWIWTKEEWHLGARIFGESVLLGFSLATYGAYTSVAPTLVLLVSITALIQGKEWKSVLRRGLEYIVSFFAGMAFYYVIQRSIVYFQDLEMFSYMGEDKLMTGITLPEIFELIKIAYRNTIEYYLGIYRVFAEPMSPKLARFIILVGAMLFIYLIIKKWKQIRTVGAKVLIVLLVLAAPLSAGLIWIMSFGNVHFLMTFTYVLLYVYLIKIAEDVYEMISVENLRAEFKIVPVLLLCMVLIWGYRNILVCNMAYMRLEESYTVSKSIATRLLDRIETCDGFEGTENVAFVGNLSKSEYFSQSPIANNETLDIFNKIALADKSVVHGFTYDYSMYQFLNNIMHSSLELRSYSRERFSEEENEIISELTTFPADDCVVKLDDTIVVKLSE